MHEGHRQRMLNRLENSTSSLTDHELLEILLYNASPRINTNPIAHDLLSAFGSLYGVLNADIDSLMQIKSVGKNTACYIKIVAKFINLTKDRANPLPSLYSYKDFKNYVIEFYKDATSEILTFFLLNKKHQIIVTKTYSDKLDYLVNINTIELTKLIAINKPYAIVIAHNHLSGNCMPTESDNDATKKLAVIFNISNVQFYDHIICCKNTTFSYNNDGNLKDIKNLFNLKTISDNLIK